MSEARRCPVCGKMTSEERSGVYVFPVGDDVPGGPIEVTDSVWRECTACGEHVLRAGLVAAIQNEHDKRVLEAENARLKAEVAQLTTTAGMVIHGHDDSAAGRRRRSEARCQEGG